MTARRKIRLACLPLAAMLLLLLLAGFLAPYDPAAQERALSYAPPTRVHFIDAAGHVHPRPFIYGISSLHSFADPYVEDHARRFPLRFFARGDAYTVLGFRCDRHLLLVDTPARLALLGTDGMGRDILSRLLFGGRLSLLAGLIATALSLGIGIVVGAAAGFVGGWLDRTLMRLADLFLALPWLYLLLAARGFMPLRTDPSLAFFLIIAALGTVGWARPARLIRGVVLSAKERNFVLAAKGFGASGPYLLRRHVLPQAAGPILTQAALLVPQYVLAEVTLSFLGLGMAEPLPSWGNMLSDLQQFHVLVSYWWMLTPVIAIVPVFLTFHILASVIHDEVQFATP
jgi:peptide/nickel transport system permease protein